MAKGIDPGLSMRNPMENVDLKRMLRNTEKASRDAEAVFDATQRPVVSIGGRLDSIESRISSLETRTGVLERPVASIADGVDGIARANHRIEQMLGDIFAKLGG
jgi:hypothetical protein